MVAYRKKVARSWKWSVRLSPSARNFVKRGGGEILFTADTLTEPENYRERSWGKKAAEQIIDICVDAVMRI